MHTNELSLAKTIGEQLDNVSLWVSALAKCFPRSKLSRPADLPPGAVSWQSARAYEAYPGKGETKDTLRYTFAPESANTGLALYLAHTVRRPDMSTNGPRASMDLSVYRIQGHHLRLNMLGEEYMQYDQEFIEGIEAETTRLIDGRPCTYVSSKSSKSSARGGVVHSGGEASVFMRRIVRDISAHVAAGETSGLRPNHPLMPSKAYRPLLDQLPV